MEVCKDSKEVVSNYKDNQKDQGMNYEDFGSTRATSFSPSESETLDKSQLLSLFGENSENVEYYYQLRKLVCGWNEKQSGPLVCDPRDTQKVEHVGCWRPASLLVDLSDVIKQCQGTEGTFASKQTALDDDDEKKQKEDGEIVSNDDDGEIPNQKNGVAKNERSFHCGVKGCGNTFASLALYEAHYHRCHNYECATCRRAFVSSFLLDVHIQENHDSYFQILSTRIDMYCCLVETCCLKFRTAELRKNHLVKEHKFPSNFSFHQPLKDVKLAPPPSDPNESQMDVSNTCSESESCDSVPKLESPKNKDGGRRGAKSKRGANQRIPTTVCFGRGSQRGFQRRGRGGRGGHWHQTQRPDVDTKVDIESVDMKELADSLS